MVSQTHQGGTTDRHPTTQLSYRRLHHHVTVVGASYLDAESHLREFAGQQARGNQMMFVNQGIRQLRLYPERSATCQRHFLLFVETYPAALRAEIAAIVDSWGAHYLEVNAVDDLLAFIQRHGADAGTIKQLDFFAHGVIGRIEFGYATATATAKADAYRFIADHARRLSPKAFAYDGRLYSYACRTGLGNPVECKFMAPRMTPSTNTAWRKRSPMRRR